MKRKKKENCKLKYLITICGFTSCPIKKKKNCEQLQPYFLILIPLGQTLDESNAMQ
jgi:hypothetical protein